MWKVRSHCNSTTQKKKEGLKMSNKNYKSFKDAREIARSLKLKGRMEYQKYSKEKGLPEGIPSYPDHVYENKGWVDWGDWLGFNFKLLPFPEAREVARLWDVLNIGCLRMFKYYELLLARQTILRSYSSLRRRHYDSCIGNLFAHYLPVFV